MYGQIQMSLSIPMLNIHIDAHFVFFKMSPIKCLKQNVSLKMSHSKCLIQSVSFKMSHTKCLTQNNCSKCVTQNVFFKMSQKIRFP